MPSLLSLFDFTGSWSAPYFEAGWYVVRVDIKLGMDIRDFNVLDYPGFDGILMAPPCTDFARSGASYWNKKDDLGITEQSVDLVNLALAIKDYYSPKFWALENPAGRINDLVPKLGKPAYKFHPYHYGESYSKLTYLWGSFVPPMPLFLGGEIGIPVRSKDNFIMKLGGKSERTKELRSVTPGGFARAFYLANSCVL